MATRLCAKAKESTEKASGERDRLGQKSIRQRSRSRSRRTDRANRAKMSDEEVTEAEPVARDGFHVFALPDLLHCLVMFNLFSWDQGMRRWRWREIPRCPRSNPDSDTAKGRHHLPPRMGDASHGCCSHRPSRTDGRELLRCVCWCKATPLEKRVCSSRAEHSNVGGFVKKSADQSIKIEINAKKSVLQINVRKS